MSGTFFLPGRSSTIYRKREGSAFGLSGDAATRIGAHEIEFGVAFEQRTYWRFDLQGAGLARYYADGHAEAGEGFASYEALPFDILRSVAYYYGYDFRGQREVNSEDLDAYFTIDEATGERGNTDVAPYRPRYYAGYVQDRLTWQALTLNVGLRVEAFDNNAQALKDPYTPVPIIRAGSLGSTPDGIGDDFAVYFNDHGDIVGYRDLDGRFFDARGSESSIGTVTQQFSGQVQHDADAPRSAAFAQTPVHVVLDRGWGSGSRYRSGRACSPTTAGQRAGRRPNYTPRSARTMM